MAKKQYTVTSAEGAERYATEIGETVTLEIDVEQELALTAAGWLEHDKKTKEAKK